MKKMLSILMVLMMVLSMISLAGAEALPVSEGTELRMATGYNNAKTGLTFDPETIKDGSITLADGVTYTVGDLKPTWVELEKILGVKFVSVYQGHSNKDEFNEWYPKLQDVDMVCGNADQLSAAGVESKLINIADYLDRMPNFKAFLETNPIVRLSITGDTTNGAIYFSPYFDGVNDIERMPRKPATNWPRLFTPHICPPAARSRSKRPTLKVQRLRP